MEVRRRRNGSEGAADTRARTERDRECDGQRGALSRRGGDTERRIGNLCRPLCRVDWQRAARRRRQRGRRRWSRRRQARDVTHGQQTLLCVRDARNTAAWPRACRTGPRRNLGGGVKRRPLHVRAFACTRARMRARARARARAYWCACVHACA
eukprot:3844856-Pleurochrysis_carterae.AAC.3